MAAVFSSIDQVLALAEHEFYLLPVWGTNEEPPPRDSQVTPGKSPHVSGWPAKSTTDPATLRAWARKWPRCNWGIHTGKSGLVVLDVDQHGGADGWINFTVWARKLGFDPTELTQTVTALTPHDGFHFLYRYDGDDIGPTNNVVAPGIDIRAANSFIVCAPSNLDGKPYEWEAGHGPDEIAIAPLPPALATAIIEAKGKGKARRKGKAKAAIGNGQVMDGATWTYEKVEAFKDQITWPDPVGEGERNTSLTSFAGRLRNQGLDEANLLPFLQYANNRNPAPMPQAEVATIARSAGAMTVNPPATPDAPGAWNLHTDAANRDRLIKRHGSDLRHTPAHRWLAWDGRRWATDDLGSVQEMALETVRHIYAEAAEIDNRADRMIRARWARTSESGAHIDRMIKLASTAADIATRDEALDAKPWLLCVENGTLDLRTGTLRDHERADLITQLAPVDYRPDARNATWDKVLSDVTGNDKEYKAYLQRAAGMALVGEIRDEVFFLMIGPGNSGKTTWLEALLSAVGMPGYGYRAPVEVFLDQAVRSGANPHMAAMRAARIVGTSEAGKGKVLDVSKIKEITGGAAITVRELYRKPFTFKPSFSIFLESNHVPTMPDDDTGLWRRVRELPFANVIPEAERDPAIKLELTTDPGARSAILAWAVGGALAWQEQGLGTCAKVGAATKARRREMDPLAAWLADRCELGDQSKSIASLDLLQDYDLYCEDGQERPIASRDFSKRLQALGCRHDRVTADRRRTRIWRGITLRDDDQNGQR